MPYYAIGDYYGRGDYYRGDPFIHKKIGGALRSVAGVVGGLGIPGVSTVAKGVSLVLGGGRAAPATPATAGTIQGFEAPETVRTRTRIGLPGLPIYERDYETVEGAVMNGAAVMVGGKKKRRSMNPMNVKALRRASRRIDGFARTARKALKHTPWQLVSRSSRRGPSPGVITRSEAARALKR